MHSAKTTHPRFFIGAWLLVLAALLCGGRFDLTPPEGAGRIELKSVERTAMWSVASDKNPRALASPPRVQPIAGPAKAPGVRAPMRACVRGADFGRARYAPDLPRSPWIGVVVLII